MSQEDTRTTTVHPDVLELAALLRPAWPSITAQLHATGVPLCEGEAGGDGGQGGEGGEGAGGGGQGGEGEGGDGGRQTFDKAYVEKIRREAAGYRTRAQEAEARAKEFEDRDKSEQEKAAERTQAAEKRAQEAEAKVLRAEVAAAKGVPAKLAKFLTGSSKEDLETSADELLSELKPAGGGTSFDGGAREGGQTPPLGDIDAAIRHAAGRG
jgi:hypothetical protein